jgi:hypothetical protein
LTPTKGQSRQTTDQPALVVWVYARDAGGKYVDCQGVRASFIDDHGDVYPANGYSHGAFSQGFSRQAYVFKVFPRRPAQLKLRLSPFRSEAASTVLIDNPSPQTGVADWKPETLPATRRIEDTELKLESLVIETNGGPPRWWEPLSLHWRPVFRLNAGGEPATNWEAPEWVAEDPTGNRGQTLGLHEPLQKFIATTYPKPEAVSEETRRWRLPVARLPTTPQGIQWNTNRVMRDLSVTVIGLFPPGAYTFSQGRLSNPPGSVSSMAGWTGLGKQVLPGKWQYWSTHGATNYTAFLRWTAGKGDQRIAVGLVYQQDQVLRTQWGRLDSGGEVRAFVFEPLPADAQEVGVDIVLLEPLRAQFVVRAPLEN